jgi:hypothetical protein
MERVGGGLAHADVIGLRRQARVNLVGEGTYGDFSLRVCAAHLDVFGYRFKRQQFRLFSLCNRNPNDIFQKRKLYDDCRSLSVPVYGMLIHS